MKTSSATHLCAGLAVTWPHQPLSQCSKSKKRKQHSSLISSFTSLIYPSLSLSFFFIFSISIITPLPLHFQLFFIFQIQTNSKHFLQPKQSNFSQARILSLSLSLSPFLTHLLYSVMCEGLSRRMNWLTVSPYVFCYSLCFFSASEALCYVFVLLLNMQSCFSAWSYHAILFLCLILSCNSICLFDLWDLIGIQRDQNLVIYRFDCIWSMIPSCSVYILLRWRVFHYSDQK